MWIEIADEYEGGTVEFSQFSDIETLGGYRCKSQTGCHRQPAGPATSISSNCVSRTTTTRRRTKPSTSRTRI